LDALSLRSGSFQIPQWTTRPQPCAPDGVQIAYGPRVPLLMFGGPVTAGIDSRWNSHVSIPKTVLDLLGLPPLGVPRVDDAPSLADLVDSSVSNPRPPVCGTTITQPTPPPTLTSTPAPLPPPPTPQSQPVGPIMLRDGTTLPPPDDQPITAPKHPAHQRKTHAP
jgi:hypothetical protein